MRQTASSCPVATTRPCENIASESPVISSIPAALGKDSLLSWVNRPEGIQCAPSHRTALMFVKLLRALSEALDDGENVTGSGLCKHLKLTGNSRNYNCSSLGHKQCSDAVSHKEILQNILSANEVFVS